MWVAELIDWLFITFIVVCLVWSFDSGRRM
jgi:hypothetical protein